MSDLVAIRTLSSELEANVVKSALDAFGVECMISSDDCGGQRPPLALTQGIRVLVKAEDAERAEEVLTIPA